MQEQEAYEKAKQRVEAKLGFYIHLGVYLLVNALLVILNVTIAKGYFWAIWPIAGWGLGLIIHGIIVYSYTSGSTLKKRMIEKEMEKEGFR
jgi:hypothetical protein